MSKKIAPLSIAPLQRFVAEPITDPSELAAFETQRTQYQREIEHLHTPGSNGALQDSQVQELCQRLSAEDWPALLTQLIAHLTAEQKLELVAWLTPKLPPSAVRQLEKQLREKLAS